VTANGLDIPWHGRVWLNPPFDRYVVGRWIRKLADHGSGIALLHARTEAEWFEPCWRDATAILFLTRRLHFHRPDGTRASANSGAPPCLVAFGDENFIRLWRSGIKGWLVTDWRKTGAACGRGMDCDASDRLDIDRPHGHLARRPEQSQQYPHPIAR
jgi:hypothetical protein